MKKILLSVCFAIIANFGFAQSIDNVYAIYDKDVSKARLMLENMSFEYDSKNDNQYFYAKRGFMSGLKVVSFKVYNDKVSYIKYYFNDLSIANEFDSFYKRQVIKCSNNPDCWWNVAMNGKNNKNGMINYDCNFFEIIYNDNSCRSNENQYLKAIKYMIHMDQFRDYDKAIIDENTRKATEGFKRQQKKN